MSVDQTPKCGCRTHRDPDAVGTWRCDVHGLVEYQRMDEAARAAHWKVVIAAFGMLRLDTNGITAAGRSTPVIVTKVPDPHAYPVFR